MPSITEWWRLSQNGRLTASHLHPHGNLGPKLPELTFPGKADFQILMWNLPPSKYWHAYLHAQLCLTLYGPVDCSPQGCSVRGIFQARILEWVAMSSSRRSSPPRDRAHICFDSCIGRWILYHLGTWEAQASTPMLKCYKHWESQNLHLSQWSGRKISVFKLLCCFCSEYFSMIPKIVPCPLPSSQTLLYPSLPLPKLIQAKKTEEFIHK